MTPPNEAFRVRTPAGLGWLALRQVRNAPGRGPLFAWAHAPTGTQVLSELAFAELPKSGRTGPQWLISIVSKVTPEPARPSAAQTKLALCAFGMLGAEEDNHHPGNARYFWLPLDPSERVECECKTDEDVIVEPDGYTWTNPKHGECRGCENEEIQAAVGLVRPCPIHRERRTA